MSKTISLPTRISLLARKLLPERACGPLLHLLAYRSKSLLSAHGHGRSLKQRTPADADGQPLPWMPYWVSTLLRERLGKAHRVFEYGAGASTLFFARLARSVRSVEHDRGWYEKVLLQLPANAVLTHQPEPGRYVAEVAAEGEHWDMVVVDGQHRVDCFAAALRQLTAGGVIVLDDSQRPDYAAVHALAAAAGFRWLAIEGHKPGSIGLHTATLFYRDHNCLHL